MQHILVMHTIFTTDTNLFIALIIGLYRDKTKSMRRIKMVSII